MDCGIIYKVDSSAKMWEIICENGNFIFSKLKEIKM